MQTRLWHGSFRDPTASIKSPRGTRRNIIIHHNYSLFFFTCFGDRFPPPPLTNFIQIKGWKSSKVFIVRLCYWNKNLFYFNAFCNLFFFKAMNLFTSANKTFDKKRQCLQLYFFLRTFYFMNKEQRQCHFGPMLPLILRLQKTAHVIQTVSSSTNDRNILQCNILVPTLLQVSSVNEFPVVIFIQITNGYIC